MPLFANSGHRSIAYQGRRAVRAGLSRGVDGLPLSGMDPGGATARGEGEGDAWGEVK